MRPFSRKVEFIPTMLFQRRFSAPPVDEAKIEALARLLDWAGWPSPVIFDDYGNVIAGGERVDAARLFGDAHAAPTVLARDLTPEDRAAFEAADARLAAKVSGSAELLCVPRAPATHGHASEAQAVAVTRTGDLWQVGRHRLACGDARHFDAVEPTLDDKADAVFLDPPQNLFGQLKRASYVKGLVQLMVTAMIALRNGGLLFVGVDYRNLHTWLRVTANVDLPHIETCTWVGARGVGGGLYPCGHKLVCVFRRGGPHINNVALDSERTNAWLHAAIAEHPTALPPQLIAEVIEDTTPNGGVALQICAGPGFCLDAAERTGRIAAIVEHSPTRCDAMLRRWQREFGCEPVLEATGERFSERAAQGATR